MSNRSRYLGFFNSMHHDPKDNKPMKMTSVRKPEFCVQAPGPRKLLWPVFRWFAVVGLSAISVICMGCGEVSKEQSGKQEVKKIPKQKFHRPKTLAAAIIRLEGIHASLFSDEPIPEPKKFTVIEIIHGTGANAHSHFHLANPDGSHDSNMDDHGDHEKMESKEVTHQIEVDVFTELSDVIRWLPRIAAKESLDEAAWLLVNQKVKSLESLSSELNAANLDSVKRAIFEKHANSIDELIQQLKWTTEKASEKVASEKEPKA